jgi:hypothetical protein
LFKSSISFGVRLSFNNRLIVIVPPSADANKTKPTSYYSYSTGTSFTAGETAEGTLTLHVVAWEVRVALTNRRRLSASRLSEINPPISAPFRSTTDNGVTTSPRASTINPEADK